MSAAPRWASERGGPSSRAPPGRASRRVFEHYAFGEQLRAQGVRKREIPRFSGGVAARDHAFHECVVFQSRRGTVEREADGVAQLADETCALGQGVRLVSDLPE